MWLHIRHVLGDHVVMLCRLVRYCHPSQLSELPCPHTGAVDDIFGGHRTLFGRDSRHPTILFCYTCDWNVFKNLSAVNPGTSGNRHCCINWIDTSIVRHVET